MTTPGTTSGEASRIRRIGILGAGRVGTALARALIDAGYVVKIAGSGEPALIDMIVSVVAPGARAARAEDAVADADMVLLAIPLHRITTVDASTLHGRLVVDAMNYWPPVDGPIPEFEDAEQGTSPIVQALLPGARVVKSFNHTGYHDLEPDRRPPGHPDRRAMAVAGDQASDVAMVAQVVDAIGYDAVRIHSLAAGRLLEPGELPFGARLDAAGIADAMAGAPFVHARRELSTASREAD